MALRILNEASSPTTELSASVCIVGAGIHAGLIAATRLARDKKTAYRRRGKRPWRILALCERSQRNR